ncbi:hypothetical protein SU69_01395 [Thermosipho melanesiensis]|uniref:DNA polymerase III, beta subunit n=2 Tax=Thermosipho melanesiensis TaxID=46541 RepID=A6LJN7_THEM4|nr:hypothetical protein [Thermosipho melanesiensis]ABR30138.1 hypothetical protein Tmel_0264 [Thermosipho melanesiensis BI429]APT73335.1 hypothetical protein BW47_01435 [Thermosipho melanesiensis]OOC38723.1 hypothetical protein SU68_01395 [Thermosipho melanesiensis]OOC40528.1 hypothetical protein SU70_01395 [Thermosipho melanesiensis]OOC40792.1 hypothetical protein SU69_01395 [Thermosipho melanesiensis]
MRLVVNSNEIKKALRLIDKVVGSVEKTNRRVGFAYNHGYLNMFGSDGCLTVKYEVSEMNPTTLSFTLPLDILKFFVYELSGDVYIYSDGRYVFLKAKDESLKLKAEEFHIKKFEERYEKILNVSKNKFLNDLDFVSSHLDESGMVDLFFGDSFKLVAENSGIINYVRRDGKSIPFSWRIPYYSSRHLIKSLQLLNDSDIEIGAGVNALVLKAKHVFNVCGEELDQQALYLLEEELYRAKEFLKVGLKGIRRFLRRAMISGRNSSIKLMGNKNGIFFYASSSKMEYKGHVEIPSPEDFQVITNAYFLRASLNRLGSENLLLMKSNMFLFITTNSKKRFIILPMR